VAQANEKQCSGKLNVRASEQKLMVVFVTQVARRVVRLTLNLERTCATYANGKRRKRSKDTDRLTQRKTLLVQ
jgi:hypothetical protein